MLRSCRTARRCLTRFLDGNDPTEPTPGEPGPCRRHRPSIVAEGASWVGEIGGADFYLFSCQRCVPETSDNDSDDKDEVLNGEGWARQQVGRAWRGCASGPDAPWEPTMCAGPGPAAIPSKNSCPSMAGGWRHVSTCEFHGLGSRPGESTSSARYRVLRHNPGGALGGVGT